MYIVSQGTGKSYAKLSASALREKPAHTLITVTVKFENAKILNLELIAVQVAVYLG